MTPESVIQLNNMQNPGDVEKFLQLNVQDLPLENVTPIRKIYEITTTTYHAVKGYYNHYSKFIIIAKDLGSALTVFRSKFGYPVLKIQEVVDTIYIS